MQHEIKQFLVESSAKYGDGESPLKPLRLAPVRQDELIAEWLPLRDWTEVSECVHPDEWATAMFNQFDKGESHQVTRLIRDAALLDMEGWFDDEEIIDLAHESQEAQRVDAA